MGVERQWSALLLLLLTVPLHAQRILERRVQVIANHVRLSEALSLVARDGAFQLSYNAASVNEDSMVVATLNGTVEESLHTLVGNRFQLKETGKHIILLGPQGHRDKFKISGSVYDQKGGGPLVGVYVHEVDGKAMEVTDALGTFQLSVSGEQERTAILLMRKEYHDTVVYVGRDGALGRVPMRKRATVDRVEPLCIHERCQVSDLGVARLLIPNAQLDQGTDLSFSEERNWQITLVPTISSNGQIAPVVVNRYSLNMVAGYSRGLNGIELAGVANVESHDVNGLQIAGITNLVGRNTKGVQIAGGINHTMRSLEGVQISGIGNTVWDTLSGVQISYGVNVVKGGLRGVQISGSCNLATQNVDGTQISGGVNITPKDVRKAQISGTGNYARNVSGAQLTAGVNIARDTVGGGQVGFGGNYARHVTGGQFSFGVNIAPGDVSGGQVGFGLNYAGSVTGGQFSFGANVVPGAVEAGQVGFGLNYAGTITGGQFSFGLNAVAGTAKGTQVGALNFARYCSGGQWGLLNMNDSISGYAIGILSFSLRGYHRVDVITNDVMPLSVQFRTGTRGFHNILGYSPQTAPNGRWGFLYGIGTEPRIGKNGFLNIDLTGEQIVEQTQWVDAVNILGRFSVAYGHKLFGPTLFSIGPVANVLFTDWRSGESGLYLSSLPPTKPAYEERNGTTRISGWLGWKASVGVRF